MKIQPLIPLFATIWIGLGATVTFAQTVPASTRIPVADSTLGTQVTATDNSTITGGVQRGQNLFHSFQDFSVPTGGSATFVNPVGNQSIVTRVTGNLFSDIDGLVNTQGANLFLINPNGIVFGANAQLNVGKTFVGSTANGIDFKDPGGNSYRFGVNGNDAPLLTINPNTLLTPTRLILGGGSGEIRNLGILQPFNLSQYIGLIGGNVSLDGGKIIVYGGRVELGGLSAAGNVEFGVDGNNFRAQFPTNVARADVSISNRAEVSVLLIGDGDIAVNARNIQMSGDSTFFGGIFSGLGSPGAVAGNIVLNATGEFTLSNSSLLNVVGPRSIGTGGNIIVDANSILLQDGSTISAGTLGKGNAGNAILTAKNTVTLQGVNTSGLPNTINSIVLAGAEGNGGKINIQANSILLKDGAAIAASTAGKGNAGDVTLIAKDIVSLQGFSNFFGSYSAITSTVLAGAQGNGGNIDINANSISLQDGAVLAASTAGKGNAGNVKLIVKDTLSLAGVSLLQSPSLIVSNVLAPAEGNGGNIDINAGYFSLKDGASLATSTEGNGNAGNVNVTAKDEISISGKLDNFSSGLYVDSQSNTGSAGDIFVASPKVTLDNRGIINAKSNTGNGGNINIAGISPDAANLLILRRGSQISTSSAGTVQQGGNGGNININIPNGFIVTAPNENSDITANAFGGSGGKVTINSKQNFWIAPLSRAELAQRLGTTDPNQLNPSNLSTNNITAISQVNPNLSGQVNIALPAIDITAGLTPLPNNVVDPSDRINPNCSPKSIGNNSFTNVGRGGIPPSPKDPLNEEKMAVNWVRLNPIDIIPATSIDDPNTAQLPKPIVEAQGWMRDRNGDIILVAQSRSGTMIYPSQPASECVEK